MFRRGAVGSHFFTLQCPEDKMINHTSWPIPIGDFRDFGLFNRPESPVFAAEPLPIVGLPFHRWVSPCEALWIHSRPGRPQSHPASEDGDLSLGKLPFRRHRHVVILVADGLDQGTLLWLSGTSAGPVSPPLRSPAR